MLLTAFGAALAKFAMELVVLPLGMLQMLLRMLGGNKPVVAGRDGRDPLDALGRAVFVAAFAALSGGVGVGVGLLAGGAGFFSAGLAFAASGAALAMFVPSDLMWGTDGGDGGFGLSDQQRAEAETGRRVGDPVVRVADRIADAARATIVEDERKR